MLVRGENTEGIVILSELNTTVNSIVDEQRIFYPRRDNIRQELKCYIPNFEPEVPIEEMMLDAKKRLHLRRGSSSGDQFRRSFLKKCALIFWGQHFLSNSTYAWDDVVAAPSIADTTVPPVPHCFSENHIASLRCPVFPQRFVNRDPYPGRCNIYFRHQVARVGFQTLCSIFSMVMNEVSQRCETRYC